MGQVGLDGSGFMLGSKQVESEAQRLSTSIQNSLKSQLAGILGVAFFEQAIQKTIQFGAEISNLSKRAGVTAEAFQKMAYAFKLAVEAGRTAYLAGAPSETKKASASSPLTGFLRNE